MGSPCGRETRFQCPSCTLQLHLISPNLVNLFLNVERGLYVLISNLIFVFS